MVLASIYGSSASNGYGSGGSVNATCFSSGFATGFSSDCEFDLGFLVSASNTPGTAPMTAAPTMPVPAMNLRRLMTASSTHYARQRGAWIIPLYRGGRYPPLATAPRKKWSASLHRRSLDAG